MRVLLLRTWLTNIGNGFIDSGARGLLERALPSPDIVEVSGYPYSAGDLRASFTLQQKLLPNSGSHKRPDHPKRTNMTNLSEYFDFDIAVLPGCVLYEHSLRKLLPVLKQIREREIPIMLLGAGGGDYTTETQSYVKNILDDLDINVLLTRDNTAYECYKDDVQYSYDGIDCAFFIDEWYDPPETKTSYEVRTFDKIAEPNLETSNEIVRSTHTPFEQPYNFPIKDRLSNIRYTDPFDRENLFMADSVTDYLTLYANSVRTHSDRIHAVIPTLVYGNEAQFHYETPRANLFSQVFDEGNDIKSRPMKLNQSAFENAREDQVKATSEAIEFLKNQP